MKLKLLIGSMITLGFAATYVQADTITPATVSYWETIINRNEDNAHGLVLNQKNHLSAYVAVQAAYTDKRGNPGYDDAGYQLSPYINIAPNNKGKSSLAIATSEVYFDSQVADWARVHIATAYAPDFTNSVTSSSFGTKDMFFPEAYAELNNFQSGAPVGLFTKIGRQYLNFTAQQYTVIAHPLTEDLAFTNATAVSVGAVYANGIYADAYGYNGNPYGVLGSKTNLTSQNNIHSWGAELGYTQHDNVEGLNIFADYIANLADSLAVGYNTYGVQGPNGWIAQYPDKQHPAYALHANYNIGLIAIITDYVGMVNAFDPNVYSFNGHGAKLAAYAMEADYTLATQDPQIISIGYQGSEDAVQLYALGNAFPMPQTRMLVGYKYVWSPNIALKFEYMHDQDYAATDYASSGSTNFHANTWYGSGSTNNSILARMNITF
jgi:hypothetical protein